jgi:hypothetical protein
MHTLGVDIISSSERYLGGTRHLWLHRRLQRFVWLYWGMDGICIVSPHGARLHGLSAFKLIERSKGPGCRKLECTVRGVVKQNFAVASRWRWIEDVAEGRGRYQ